MADEEGWGRAETREIREKKEAVGIEAGSCPRATKRNAALPAG